MIDDEEFSLDKVLLKNVNRVFTDVLGETGASFVYCQLRRRHGLERGAIPRQIEPFGECLIELLGSGGEAILNMIVDGVAEELGVRAPRDRRLKFGARIRMICEGYGRAEF